jgi:hypothetical protein
MAHVMRGAESAVRQSVVEPAVPFDIAESRLDACIKRAAGALLAEQRRDGHWVFELEADATIPAEYVLLKYYLGETNPALEAKIATYLRRVQAPHGGWPLFHGGAFNISASVKAYFALKVIGDSPDAPHMLRAREAILAHGGAGTATSLRAAPRLHGIIRGKRCRRSGRDHVPAAVVSFTCSGSPTGVELCWRRCSFSRP